jgi:hypothetical protein
MYAATAWWPGFKLKTSQAELGKMEKVVSLGIIGAMRTTPTVAIEVLLAPLH